jgi:hypothetical protein
MNVGWIECTRLRQSVPQSIMTRSDARSTSKELCRR